MSPQSPGMPGWQWPIATRGGRICSDVHPILQLVWAFDRRRQARVAVDPLAGANT